MKYIDIQKLHARLDSLKKEYHSKTPFKYIVFEDFFPRDIAESIHEEYPTIENGAWDGTTYLDQKNKFQKTTFEDSSIMTDVFKELNSEPLLEWLQSLTDFEEKLIGDQELFGGGLHQSINGAFLNVHIDYNIHPKTKFHRRLNLLVFMNKEWKDEYEGHLELWDLGNNQKKLLEKIAPSFNRCVIFETNEISYHGHPKPLNTPAHVNRKSLATYYYSKSRPSNEIAGEHNTVYVNTEGVSGEVKRFSSGIKALFERLIKSK